jgi:hypothetical protein
MSLGKKVTLNTGAQIPYVLQHNDCVALLAPMAFKTIGFHTNAPLQPAGLWYLAVRPRSGRGGRLRGPQGRLPPPGMLPSSVY